MNEDFESRGGQEVLSIWLYLALTRTKARCRKSKNFQRLSVGSLKFLSVEVFGSSKFLAGISPSVKQPKPIKAAVRGDRSVRQRTWPTQVFSEKKDVLKCMY